MSFVPIKDSADATRKVDVITRTEGADTVETQAVAIINPTTGVAAAVDASGNLPTAPNVTRGTGNVDSNTLRATLASDGPAVTNLAAINTNLGARADTSATSDTGTFSLISLFKRGLQNLTTLLSRTPSLVSGRVPVDGSGVTQPVSGPLTLAQLLANITPASVFGIPIGWWPGYSAPTSTAPKQQLFDEGGAAVVRGSMLTDEGTFRANFSGAAIGVSIGTVSVSGKTVTGSGFLTSDAHLKDYFKLDADPEGAWTQILSMDSDTQITLLEPYKGVGTSGAASRAFVKPITGSGGSITVSGGNCTIASGTTTGSATGVIRKLDFLPVIARDQFSISQRIPNQTIYFGCQEDSVNPRHFARFNFSGTNANQVICETGRSATGAPTGGEIQQVTVTLPNSLTTATSLEWRVDLLPQSARFYATNKTAGDTKPILLADLSRVLPIQSDIVAVALLTVNGTSPASSTSVVVDYITGQNHNVLSTTTFSETENPRTDIYGNLETVLADDIIAVGSTSSGTPAVLCELDLINCTGALFRYHTAGVSSTYTLIVKWSDDRTNWGTVGTTYPFLSNNTTTFAGTGRTDTAVTSSIAAPNVISMTKLARYVRLECSAISLGQINAIGYGLRGVIPGQRVDLNASSTSVALLAGSSAVGDVALIYRQGTANSASSVGVIASASTNAITVKAAPGRLIGWNLYNNTSSVVYIKFHNTAGTPTAGSGVVFPIPIPPNAPNIFTLEGARGFTAGLSYTIVTGYADSDATAVTAGAIVGAIFFA